MASVITTSAKLEFLKGYHVFLASGGGGFKILLIKASPAGTYDATLTNVGTPGTSAPSTSNVGTDETTNTSGTGYTSGGFALTNVDAVTNGTQACASFSANPSWTSSTFSTTFAVIYNSTSEGGTTNRTIGCYDLGGTISVVSGTLTLTLPAQTTGTAIIRIT